MLHKKVRQMMKEINSEKSETGSYRLITLLDGWVKTLSEVYDALPDDRKQANYKSKESLEYRGYFIDLNEATGYCPLAQKYCFWADGFYGGEDSGDHRQGEASSIEEAKELIDDNLIEYLESKNARLEKDVEYLMELKIK